MKLSDAKLRTLTTPGRYFDGGGLYLDVKPAGGRYWRMKYRFSGREKLLALGVYPDVSLKTARERREDARRALAGGLDPGELKKAARTQAEREAAATFEAVARDWLAHQANAWTEGTLDAICSGLEAAVFPKIGARPMAQMRPKEVMEIVKGLDASGKGETAGRVLQRI